MSRSPSLGAHAGSWTLELALWVALYAAAFEQIEAAKNVVLFAAWALAALSLFMLQDDIQKAGAKVPEQKLRGAVVRMRSWAFLGYLVASGHIVTALVWCVAMFIGFAYRLRVRVLREAAAAQATEEAQP